MKAWLSRGLVRISAASRGGMAMQSLQDRVIIRDLEVRASVGPDHWCRDRPVPLHISASLGVRLAERDNLDESRDYGKLCKSLIAAAEDSSVRFHSLQDMSDALQKSVIEHHGGWPFTTQIVKSKGLLNGKLGIIRDVAKQSVIAERFTVDDIQVSIILGLKHYERDDKQRVLINLILETDSETADIDDVDVMNLVKHVVNSVETSSFYTIEALVNFIARQIYQSKSAVRQFRLVTVRVEKPSAVTFAKAAAVQICRTREWAEMNSVCPDDSIYLSFGSNLGDRFSNINLAMKLLGEEGFSIVNTSCLYQTKPMYVLDQPEYLNGVCEVKTAQTDPFELLRAVKKIEEKLGRTTTTLKGPRVIDLDILMFGKRVLHSDTLTIPHMGMLERLFVLEPMLDIAPLIQHPVTGRSLVSHYDDLISRDLTVRKIYLARNGQTLDFGESTRTKIMAIVNLTDDSFSDGGVVSAEPKTVVALARDLIAQGADIIDIGGHSTRPHSQAISEEMEYGRVIPLIRAIRAAGIDCPISVDTYRASIARAAIGAGADIINDVSAGSMDSNMLDVMGELGVPVILMHMRGTPMTMNDLACYPDVVADVSRELEMVLDKARQNGIRRWNIILDPGIGFAKTTENNLQLIKRFRELRAQPAFRSIPWVIGPSRKRFIGSITGEELASKRDCGTAATIAISIANGADCVRIHNVKNLRAVVKMADALRESC